MKMRKTQAAWLPFVIGLCSLVQGAFAQTSSTPVPATPNQAMISDWSEMSKTCARPEYPKASLRAEETGTVTMNFLIDARGKVIDKAILTSSGFKALDDAAMNTLSKCLFRANTKDGAPKPGWTAVQYVWSLQ